MAKTSVRSKKKTTVRAKSLFYMSKRAWVILGILTFGIIGVKLTFFSDATAFQYVGTHPNAAVQPETSTGRQLKSLIGWNGKIYAGYGDYDKNTGPVALKPFDPVSNTFASTSEHIADTQSVEIMRTIGDKIYVLHADPGSHDGPAYSVGDTSTGKAVWKNMTNITMTHVYGITSGSSPSELFLAGQLDEGSAYNEVAKVYRSTDGGATWTESLSVRSRGGYNRMMFVAKLGDKIYAQNLSTADFNGAQPQTQAWVFGGSSWSKATPIAQTYNPYDGTEFMGKILAKSSTEGGSLLAYDGRSTYTLRSNVRDYKVHSDGYVYALSYNNNDMAVMRSKDLASWEQIAVTPNNARSIAILNNTLYIGTSDSELYKAEIDPQKKDTTPPTVSLVAPSAGYTVTTSNQFAANANDLSSISKVEFHVGSTLIGTSSYKSKAVMSGCFYINGTPACYTETSDYPGSYIINWSGARIAAGTYPLKAVAYDLYGNQSESASVDITIPEGLYPTPPPDTTAPVITINRPTEGSRARKQVWISAVARDETSASSIKATIDGKTVAETPDGSIYMAVPVTKGTHILTITAIDAAGNTSEKSVTFRS